MDALTFGSNVLLRHLTFSEARFVKFQVVNFSIEDIAGTPGDMLVNLVAQNVLSFCLAPSL